MKNLLELMAKAVVDNPEQVTVRELAGERVTILQLEVAPGEIGRIIGTQGRMADAMRTIIAAGSKRLNRRFVLEIPQR